MSEKQRYLVRVARGFAYVKASDGITMPFFGPVQAFM